MILRVFLAELGATDGRLGIAVRLEEEHVRGFGGRCRTSITDCTIRDSYSVEERREA
jgi:hypothetical protein